jgi:hypothetical protein
MAAWVWRHCRTRCVVTVANVKVRYGPRNVRDKKLVAFFRGSPFSAPEAATALLLLFRSPANFVATSGDIQICIVSQSAVHDERGT